MKLENIEKAKTLLAELDVLSKKLKDLGEVLYSVGRFNFMISSKSAEVLFIVEPDFKEGGELPDEDWRGIVIMFQEKVKARMGTVYGELMKL